MENSSKLTNWCSGGIFLHTVTKIFKLGRQDKKSSKKKLIPIIRMAPLSPMSENELALKKSCCNGAAQTVVSPTSTPAVAAAVEPAASVDAVATVSSTTNVNTTTATAPTTAASHIVSFKTTTASTATAPTTATITANVTATATATSTSTSKTRSAAFASGGAPVPLTKRTPNDFIFGKVIGEGSYSTVYLTKDIHTQKEFAIKVCEKQHIIREKKTEYVKREKDILYFLSNTPFIVKLFYTFQDAERLYFVLSYAKNGELLPYINKVGSFDLDCTKFYSSEILVALEYLHNANVIHRDLKPENILLDENMHIMITDFGSATMYKPPPGKRKCKNGLSNNEERDGDGVRGVDTDDDDDDGDGNDRDEPRKRKNSFVGTAQYVSPELLTDKPVCPSSDLWAFGCIIYQMIAGLPPFRSRSEYIIFQKITKLEYEFPDGFCEQARDLVKKLLVLDSDERLGARDATRYTSIRSHPFYRGVNFDTLQQTTPPQIYPYLPGRSSNSQELRSHYRVPDHLEPGLNDKQLTRLLGLDIKWAEPEQPPPIAARPRKKSGVMDLNAEEIKEQLESQKKSSKWDSMVQGNLILKQGLIDKRKGLFSKRRMLLLTMGPHLYYADPVTHTLKGEIPWSPELRIEPKNFKTFFVHTPNRTYYLEDPEGYALDWCKAIEEVRISTYGADGT